MATFPTVTFEAAFGVNPTSEPETADWVDLSDRLGDPEGIEWGYGRQHELDRIEAGTGSVTLDNTDRALDPTNTASTYSPDVKPMVRVRVKATHLAVTYDVLQGFVEAWQPVWQQESAWVSLPLVDGFKLLAQAKTDAAYPVQSSGDRIGVLLNSVNGATPTSTTSIPAPGTFNTGLTWDGTHFRVATDDGNLIYKVDTAGAVVSSFATPGGDPTGLTWDGTNLWHADDTTDLIYKLNPTTGATISSFASPTADPADLAWDGTNLWLTNGGTIYKLNPATGATISSFSVSGYSLWGLTWDGTHLWGAGISRLIKFDPTTGAVVSAFTHPASSVGKGLTWDGTNLWLTGTSQPIYKFDYAGIDTGQSDVQAYAAADRIVLEAIQDASATEQGVFYIAPDGSATFKDRHSRITSASVATFGDDTGELPYETLDLSYEDQSIANDVTVEPEGLTAQNAKDLDSIAAYGNRWLQRSGSLVTTEAEALDAAYWLLRQYSEPRLRVESMVLAGHLDDDVMVQILTRGIGDRITVKATPPGGGARISKEVFIEHVHHSVRGLEWFTTWQLSPADSATAWQLGTAGFTEVGTTTALGY